MIPLIHTMYLDGFINALEGNAERKSQLYRDAMCPFPQKEETRLVSYASFESLLRNTAQQYGKEKLVEAIQCSIQNDILPVLTQGLVDSTSLFQWNVAQAVYNSEPHLAGFWMGATHHYGKPILVVEPVEQSSVKFVFAEVYFSILSLELYRHLLKDIPVKSNLYLKVDELSDIHHYLAKVYQQQCVLCFAQPYTGIELLPTECNSPTPLFSVKSHGVETFSESLKSALGPIFDEHDISLDVASSVTSIPRRTIQRRLEKEGLSFLKIKESLIIDKAQSLKTTGKNITQIATELHFSSVGHFCRFVRRRFNLTPTQLFEQLGREAQAA
ncbi:helix-turn-helix domain-containing protein [Vibrio sp. SCSIO 43135]|uniref:helix-turn-helix domain-containing protein n=1 Tax=Vibrio sp. SCSIO 43135 TaxID=2819096 RepID=UPI0020751077|nr:helix-turn-helix domain-containing protein [Vibrio sp. SCSIO 43135]USD40271.1 helix-turn-helix domain-containing protein [Vibrio sp. SCSIO 43135]